jgi:hypothetical protein
MARLRQLLWVTWTDGALRARQDYDLASMEGTEHYIQDSCELLAVAKLQELAEDAGLSLTHCAAKKFLAYDEYRLHPTRNVDESTLSSKHAQIFRDYKDNLARHLPVFFERLHRCFPSDHFDFSDVERDARNGGRREDFVIHRSTGSVFRVSLKNYRKSAARPQVCSGTWNSFIVNFLFEGAGAVGMVTDPISKKPFKGSDRDKRDLAVAGLGFMEVIPLLKKMDELNDEMRDLFLNSSEFEFFDEGRFDEARKHYGLQGVALAQEILDHLGQDIVKKRVLTLAGFDEGDEVLLLDATSCSDSLTGRRFRDIRQRALEESAGISYAPSGQTLNFSITDGEGQSILPVAVPFTINSNGAWWRDGEPFEGTREKSDKGHVMALRYGQRRPYKSRELATSVNTYLELKKAGVFEFDEV